MNLKFAPCLCLLAAAVFAQGQKQPATGPAPLPPPPEVPPVALAPAPPAAPAIPAAPRQPAPTFYYEQKPLTSRQYLVTPEQAQSVINRFKEAYPKMGKPRLLIYVNRDLIDQSSGVKLSGRREQIEAARGHSPAGSAAAATNAAAPAPSANHDYAKSTVKNYYHVQNAKEVPLADRQTVRDVERLFGRPLRMGGATLADQRVAAQLIGDKPLSNFTAPTEGEQARKDREALNKIADVVLEILISSRTITVPEVSGDRSYSVPDIQATAIRLSDSKIIGQASSSDLLGHGARAARPADVREVTEATALALMEDMLLQ